MEVRSKTRHSWRSLRRYYLAPVCLALCVFDSVAFGGFLNTPINMKFDSLQGRVDLDTNLVKPNLGHLVKPSDSSNPLKPSNVDSISNGVKIGSNEFYKKDRPSFSVEIPVKQFPVGELKPYSIEKVVELDVEGYDNFLAHNTPAVILYYVPWCHWCQRFLPIYDDLASHIPSILQPVAMTSNDQNGLKFAKINVHERKNRPIGLKEGIQAYPSLKIWLKSPDRKELSLHEYKGEYKYSQVIKWIQSIMTTDIEISTLEQLKNLLEIHKQDVIVLLVNPTKKMMEMKNTHLVKKFEEATFCIIKDRDLAKKILTLIHENDPSISRSQSRVSDPHPPPNVDEGDPPSPSSDEEFTDEMNAVEWLLSTSAQKPFFLLYNPHTQDVKARNRQKQKQLENRLSDGNRHTSVLGSIEDLLIQQILGISPSQLHSMSEENQSSLSEMAFPLQNEAHLDYRIHIHPSTKKEASKVDDLNAVDKFITTFQFPVIAKWSSEVAGKVALSSKPFLIAFTDHLNDNDSNDNLEVLGRPPSTSSTSVSERALLKLEDVLWNIAQTHRSEFVTLVSGWSTVSERRLIETVGVDRLPSLVYVTMTPNPKTSVNHNTMMKYYAPESIQIALFHSTAKAEAEVEASGASATASAIKSEKIVKEINDWLIQVQKRKVSPDVKSEPPLPDQNNPGPVYVVTALDWNKHVMSDGYDVIIDLYASWCGHCQVLAPIYYKVSRAFRQAKIHTVKFAKIDATANFIPGLHIRGYPTILSYPDKKKAQPIIHAGGSFDTPEEIVNFVHRTATHKFNINSVLHAFRNLNNDDELPPLDEL